jgi:hypothetical protein
MPPSDDYVAELGAALLGIAAGSLTHSRTQGGIRVEGPCHPSTIAQVVQSVLPFPGNAEATVMIEATELAAKNLDATVSWDGEASGFTRPNSSRRGTTASNAKAGRSRKAANRRADEETTKWAVRLVRVRQPVPRRSDVALRLFRDLLDKFDQEWGGGFERCRTRRCRFGPWPS